MSKPSKYLPWTKRRLPARGELPPAIKARFLPDAKAAPPQAPESNPTIMDKPFWKYMIAKGDEAYHAYSMLDLESPFRVGPTWCFDRFGQTITWLPDGRIILIGGEHEDGYDPDFCIYNDVVVVTPAEEPEVVAWEMTALDWWEDDDYQSGDEDEEEDNVWIVIDGLQIVPPKPEEITIYGYPNTVFPPTDGHVAVYVANLEVVAEEKEYIYIIGGVGYGRSVHRETTNVFRLDLSDFSIQPLHTVGELPPHGIDAVRGRKALLVGTDIVLDEIDGERYALSLKYLVWWKLAKVDAPTPAKYVEAQWCEEAFPVSDDVENGYL